MPRKTTKKETKGKLSGIQEEELIDIKDEEVIDVKSEETTLNAHSGKQGILDYLNESNLRLGVDYRKKITFRLDGHLLEGVIRPLSSDEVEMVNNTNKMGQGSLDKLVVIQGFYGEDGKTKIPVSKLDKFPAGVNSYIASEIMSLSGYALDDDATQYLKKS